MPARGAAIATRGSLSPGSPPHSRREGVWGRTRSPLSLPSTPAHGGLRGKLVVLLHGIAGSGCGAGGMLLVTGGATFMRTGPFYGHAGSPTATAAGRRPPRYSLHLHVHRVVLLGDSPSDTASIADDTTTAREIPQSILTVRTDPVFSITRDRAVSRLFRIDTECDRTPSWRLKYCVNEACCTNSGGCVTGCTFTSHAGHEYPYGMASGRNAPAPRPVRSTKMEQVCPTEFSEDPFSQPRRAVNVAGCLYCLGKAVRLLSAMSRCGCGLR
jgi:hypothetical protein